MDISEYILQQYERHPSMQPQDVVKLCYQAARGAEHLLMDIDGARAYFNEEYENTGANETELFEPISDEFARVNLAAWKNSALPGEWLFNMFSCGLVQLPGGEERLRENLEKAGKIVSAFDFSLESWEEYISDYYKKGMPALHHSEEYRRAERPAYRIVPRYMLRLITVLKLAAGCGSRPCVIAIDGRAGSGKSTLAQWLSKILPADIVKMDDFFLPLPLRTDERLETPGGNVHYERFETEVLPKIKSGAAFSYRVFSCSTMDYAGYRKIASVGFRIVEGSYSMHPEFGDYADISVFSDAEPEEQLRRIKERDGESYAQIFKERWIPMEESYFNTFGIREKANIII